MNPTDWQIVRSSPLFGAMTKEQAAELVGTTAPQTCEKGMMLFQQGEPAKAFFVVLEGIVKISRITVEGKEAVMSVFRTGETFAEAAMFLGGRYPATAEVVTDARLLRIDGERLRRQIKEKPELALSMLASASYHLKLLVDQIEQIRLLSAPRRVANFLLQQTKHAEGTATVELPYEKSLLANRLGMKPESFSRALAKLRPVGVSVDRDIVTIADMQALTDFVARSDEDAD